ncbi:MAG TPA: HAD-IA family hydrolase, partial [Bacteroidales bacterium]|nr:HAD-IA family hydrolase [Bacteroidales bacterium]
WSAETITIAYERFHFFNALDGIVVSGAEKIIKPDKRLFQILLKRYDLDAAKSLFIDDNINNINTANELGFRTIHFQNPAQLRIALSDLGLL